MANWKRRWLMIWPAAQPLLMRMVLEATIFRPMKQITLLANEFLQAQTLPSTRSTWPTLIGMIGLVGSGKSTIAKLLAREINAVVIRGDAIRVFLRERGFGYDLAPSLSLYLVFILSSRGISIVFDSDHVDIEKRVILQELAKSVGARVGFVRTTCDLDGHFARILEMRANPDPFYAGAQSSFALSDEDRPRVVCMREMTRRLPRHYTWHDEEGGVWRLRELDVPNMCTLDTTKSHDVHACLRQFLEGL